MSDKMTRKELKAPDAFQKAGSEARDWLQARQSTVAIGIGIFLLVLTGVAIFSRVQDRNEEQAAKALGGVLSEVTRPVEGSPAAPPSAPSEKPNFKTEKDKDEAIVKSLTAFKAEHPHSRSSASAALPLGQALFRLGRYDEAMGQYEEFLKVASPDEPLRAVALEGRGYVFEAKGQLDQALAAFDDMSRDNKTDFMSGMGLYHRARVLILENKKDEAAKALSDIPGSAPNTAAARMATERMALLASEGINVPTPAKPVDAGTP